MNQKLSPPRVKNDATRVILLTLFEGTNKKGLEVTMRPYDRTKTFDDQIKKHGRRNLESNSKRRDFANKTIIAAKTFCFKILIYLRKFDIKYLVKNYTLYRERISRWHL